MRNAVARRAVAWSIVLLSAAVVCGTSGPARADDLTTAIQEQTAKYAGQLADLAGWCDKHGLAEQAKKTRSWLTPHDPYRLYVIILPEAVGRPALPEDAPEDVVKWDARFAQLRREQANALENLARRTILAQRASLAFDLVMAALRENPDHDGIRRMLGYQKYRDQWHTQYEVANLRSGLVWHDKFGWLPRANVRRYEQGQRYAGGRWVSAEEDARLHREIQSGWVVETEHYQVRTNYGLEAGVQLGKKLERLYRVWKQLFIRYYATEEQVTALFGGRSRGRAISLPRHKVAYFRDRDDYVRHLRALIPNVEISIGIYVDTARQVCFFAGDEYDERTMYHEATHQLFNETRPVPPGVAGKGNFWILEGIAMYMESLRDEGEFHVLGGLNDVRLQDARYRLLHDDFYVPLADFTGIGLKKMQEDKRIRTLYSQAAGLTHFLIHSDGGRYRDALVAYLEAVYSGRDNANTLPRLTGTGFAELDRQYRKFIESGAKQLSAGEVRTSAAATRPRYAHLSTPVDTSQSIR